MSLSARRAWIEMLSVIIMVRPKSVALRKESVDRNFYCLAGDVMALVSLSARRAWIEIQVSS